jgi:hypothetical protein
VRLNILQPAAYPIVHDTKWTFVFRHAEIGQYPAMNHSMIEYFTAEEAILTQASQRIQKPLISAKL